jgi:NTP pyrophosphatase (non-canonical NTP hydrolase)
MTFEEYQLQAKTTARYPDVGHNFVYPTLGLSGEAGEVAEKVKKIIRDDGGVVSDEKKQAIAKELGDVLWYVSQLSTEFGLSLEDVARGNAEKLQARAQQGTIHGSGDNR